MRVCAFGAGWQKSRGRQNNAETFADMDEYLDKKPFAPILSRLEGAGEYHWKEEERGNTGMVLPCFVRL